jgi:F-type H+-transporting ATPase subunit b
MFKRTLAVLVAMLALTVARASAADSHSPADPAAAHGAAAATGGHDAHAAGDHGGHIQGDERLVPIPPSKDTVVSAIWVIIIFLIMLAILYRTAWQQVLAGLKKREERIRGDIAEAEASRKRAEATLAQYNQQLAAAESQVREIIAKGQADAERIATSLKMQAQQEAEEAKERAQRDIEAARKAAVADIYAQAADLSTAIAEKILRRSLNADDQRDLVARSLEQLQTAGKG